MDSVFTISNAQKNGNSDLKSLIFAVKSGKSENFGQIYNLLFDKVFRFIFFRVGHKETAEDIAEEVFIKAFSGIGGLASPEAFEGWLFKIARNMVIDYYREKKQLVDIQDLENTLEYESNILDSVNLQLNQKTLLKILKTLPSDQQTVIRLRFMEEMEIEQIAEILEKSEGAIRVIQHRAIEKLKNILEETHII